MTDPILVFGAGGQVGRELLDLAARRGIALHGFDRAALDIADSTAVRRLLAENRPSLLVNAAAYTKVDKAESEPEAARRDNVDGPAVLAAAAAQAGVPLLHISTDYVFDGTKAGPYLESDPVAPLGVYGRTKLEGEEAVRRTTDRHLILRTAWVYGRHGNNFLKTMLRLAAERDELRVVADQVGNPTATPDLAEAILAVAARAAAGEARWGTYHFAGSGATSWHGFADAIVAAAAPFTGRRPPVTAIGTTDYPTPARRPANSQLDSGAFAQAFGYRALDWRERVAQIVPELAGGAAKG
ncbi:dTDP-4-dehydrorhamnose reductase [Ancylobacter oerskovii]|uniref:dTDP-4-dehydrorhamnose reductase n=1 Tax=Ancylobacter oerskovii TaxID=459519 RepID=A0ABW4YW25_9HYPH|nr:dTDP-4-dehydrorhamnose reductase [Ancylobacter oerskovii]MBS7543124.1 dTDP-4-dehydrorhamnose reductase [Ancylobacter oerskovii]